MYKQPFVFSSQFRKPLDFMQQQAKETINALPVANGDLYVAVQDVCIVITEYDNKSGKPILAGDRIYTPASVLENAMSQRVRYGPAGIIKNK